MPPWFGQLLEATVLAIVLVPLWLVIRLGPTALLVWAGMTLFRRLGRLLDRSNDHDPERKP